VATNDDPVVKEEDADTKFGFRSPPQSYEILYPGERQRTDAGSQSAVTASADNQLVQCDSRRNLIHVHEYEHGPGIFGPFLEHLPENNIVQDESRHAPAYPSGNRLVRDESRRLPTHLTEEQLVQDDSLHNTTYLTENEYVRGDSQRIPARPAENMLGQPGAPSAHDEPSNYPMETRGVFAIDEGVLLPADDGAVEFIQANYAQIGRLMASLYPEEEAAFQFNEAAQAPSGEATSTAHATAHPDGGPQAYPEGRAWSVHVRPGQTLTWDSLVSHHHLLLTHICL
jgi:hypothetical protein